jgi:hypothetical protein
MEQVTLLITTPLLHCTYCMAVNVQVEYCNNRIFSRDFTEHSDTESSFILLTNRVVPVVRVLAPVWCRVHTSASLFAHLLHLSATELGPPASCGRTTQFSDVVSLASRPRRDLALNGDSVKRLVLKMLPNWNQSPNVAKKFNFFSRNLTMWKNRISWLNTHFWFLFSAFWWNFAPRKTLPPFNGSVKMGFSAIINCFASDCNLRLYRGLK